MTAIRAVAAVALILGATGCSEAGGEDEAQAACQDEIASQMKLPDTTVLKEVEIMQSNDGTYEVAGFVEAENSLGGTVRSKFVCDLSYIKSSDSWIMQLAKTYDGETFETLSEME